VGLKIGVVRAADRTVNALRVVRRRPGLSRALLAGVAGGGRRRDAGVDRVRLRFVGALPVVGSLPVGAGSPDLSGKI
jgi:hypothetical protein